MPFESLYIALSIIEDFAIVHSVREESTQACIRLASTADTATYREGRPFGDLLESGKNILDGEHLSDAWVAGRTTRCNPVVAMHH